MIWTDKLVALACRVKRGGVVLNYHTLTAEQTAVQIATWAPHFDFISHDELGGRLERPGKKPFCLITFDDAKKSNFTEAAPVLKRFGVPAVFYVITKFTDGEMPGLWFDIYDEFRSTIGQCPKELGRSALKRMPNGERLALLEKTYESYGFRATLASADVQAMSWDNVRSLRKQGHTIGAHSETHAILTTLPAAQAQGEIQRSIARVSAEIGEPCASFAFPNGNYTPELAQFAMGCGARTVMTTDPLWMGSQEQPWRLPRIQIEAPQSPRWHAFKVFVASLGCVVVSGDGTGRRYVWERRRKTAFTRAAPNWSVGNAAGG